MTKTRALFLDRDGTINVDYGYVHRISDFKFIDGIFDVCRVAQERGYIIIVITNQSGIERGYFTETEFTELNNYMCDEFRHHGITITDVFFCPSLSGPNRKPNPGMFLAAQKKYNIDMAASVSVGDSQRDIDAAQFAGVGKNWHFHNNFAEIKDEL